MVQLIVIDGGQGSPFRPAELLGGRVLQRVVHLGLSEARTSFGVSVEGPAFLTPGLVCTEDNQG